MSGGRVQRLVRPGRARTTPAARPPGPAPPHLRASCAVAAACACGASVAMRAACRRRVTAASGNARPNHPNAARPPQVPSRPNAELSDVGGVQPPTRPPRRPAPPAAPRCCSDRGATPRRRTPAAAHDAPTPPPARGRGAALRGVRRTAAAPAAPLHRLPWGRGLRGGPSAPAPRVALPRDSGKRPLPSAGQTPRAGFRTAARTRPTTAVPPNDPAQRRRQPPAGPRNQPMSRRPLQRLVRPGRLGHTPRQTPGPRPTPTSPLRAAFAAARADGLRGPSGPRAGRRVTASRGAAPPGHPTRRWPAVPPRPNDSLTRRRNGDRGRQPADHRRSGAAPGSAGASGSRTAPPDGLARPSPTSTLRAPSRPPAPPGLRGPWGRVPEARDCGRRGRPAEPPARADGPRPPRPNDPAQRRRKPPTGPPTAL